MRTLIRYLVVLAFAGVMPMCVHAQGDPSADIEAEFRAWLGGVAEDALAQGIRAEVIDEALGSARLNKKVLKSSVSQPERRETLADYLSKRISLTRVTKGREFFSTHRALLQDIEAKTGVDAEVIVAIWGVETAYGNYMGDAPVISGLASLAFQSDRKPFFRKELLSALQMLNKGLIDLPRMTGSWAGAMGQPQFMPSSYLEYARDYDGDGIVDIWSNLGDVFYSIASYLSRHGWQSGEPWGAQATVREAFRNAKPGLPDRSKTAMACVSPYDRTCRTEALSFWLKQGVIAPLSSDFGLAAKARVVMPDGASGPAYLAPKNFDVILTYNRSSFYAISVGVLASFIADGEQGAQ